ncbi:hypothetical protein [Pyrobaculum aerophilum]|uniref:hypothetical protein n=1 Tax=Pyrobaculum aerophilum TaxID=13773 RepID=UPI002FDA5B9B
MTSLEVLILTAFALIIIFAALPYVINTLYASLAPLEYRSAVGYVLAFADALEGDFGMSGARKYFKLPKFIYGSFGAVNRTYTVSLTCGGDVYSFRWYSFTLWYNSTYLVGSPGIIKGVGGGLITGPGDTILAVNATGMGVFAYPRVFVVSGSNEAYVYFINATVRARGGGYLTYEIGGVETRQYPNCIGATLTVAGRSVSLPSGTVYVVTQYANITLR